MSLIAELKRRNVFRVGIAYAVGAWLLLQVADILLEAFAAPDWTLRLVVVLLIIGLPVALFFAWAFELTPEGIKRESEVDRSTSITHQTGRRLDRAIIAVLVLALGYFAVDKFVMRPGALTDAPDIAAEPGPGTDTPASAAPALPTDKSIAVLPFDHRSSREEDRFFTTGIHDDLLTQLAQISELRVISRTSVAQFEDTDKSIRDIAELLNVATILEGGVQRAGDQVRINLQLIDAATDAHLWAKTYDRELTASNVFAIQSEIATAVAAAMRATLTPEDRERISNVPTENMAALEEYFKARAEMDTRSVPSIESARLRFQAARELDPGFALAYAGEAQAILLLADDGTSYGDIPVTEAVGLARPLLDTAFELAPGEPKVLATYGLLENTADQLEAADDWFDRALDITPDDGEVLNWKRINLAELGRMKDSLAVNERMIEADPYSQVTLFNGAATLSTVGDGSTVKVDRLLDRLEELNPGLAWTTRGLVAETRGQSPEASQHYFRAITLDSGAARARERLGNLLASLGLDAEALNVDPEAEEYLPFYRKDYVAMLEQSRRDVTDSGGGTAETLFLISDLVNAGLDEEALELAEQLWLVLGESPDQLRFHSMNMAIAARRSERPVESQRYRDAYARFVQTQIENDIQSRFRYFNEAALAAFDGRDEDALAAMTRSIDRGLRWTGFYDLAAFDSLRESLAFQTELARMEELATADRYRILTDLCAPAASVTDWTPAPESCALWRERDTTAAAPI